MESRRRPRARLAHPRRTPRRADCRISIRRRMPSFLRRPEVAGLVVATLQRGLDKGLYDLHLVSTAAAGQSFAPMAERHNRSRRQPNAGSNRQAVLAAGILRSLGEKRAGVGAYCGVYRKQSGESGDYGGEISVSVVQRLGDGELKFRRCALKRAPQLIVAHASACRCRLQPAVVGEEQFRPRTWFSAR